MCSVSPYVLYIKLNIYSNTTSTLDQIKQSSFSPSFWKSVCVVDYLKKKLTEFVLCSLLPPCNKLENSWLYNLCFPTIVARRNGTVLSSRSKRGYKTKQKRMCGSKGIATIWTWEQFGLHLMISVKTVSYKHLKKKGSVLIRPLVLKLAIDFHCGGLWASDLFWFLAPTKAKLSHLEAGSAFRDSGSTQTPPANLFPSDGTFLRSSRFFTSMDLLPKILAHFFLFPSISLGRVWVSPLCSVTVQYQTCNFDPTATQCVPHTPLFNSPLPLQSPSHSVVGEKLAEHCLSLCQTNYLWLTEIHWLADLTMQRAQASARR